MPSFAGNIQTEWHDIAHKKLYTPRYHTVKTQSLYDQGSR